jgi:hypothetical protein
MHYYPVLAYLNRHALQLSTQHFPAGPNQEPVLVFLTNIFVESSSCNLMFNWQNFIIMLTLAIVKYIILKYFQGA